MNKPPETPANPVYENFSSDNRDANAQADNEEGTYQNVA